MLRKFSAPSAIAWLVAFAACDVPPDGSVDDLTTVAQPLNGTIQFPSGHGCSDQQKEKIKAAARIVAAAVRGDRTASGDAFFRCLSGAVLTETNGKDVDTIITDLAANMPTRAFCDDLPVNVIAEAPRNLVGQEKVTFDRTALNERTPEDVAGVMIHEVSHNKNYRHHDTTREPAASLTRDYSITVPEQVQRCLLNQNPNQGSRLTLLGSTTLAHVGIDVGRLDAPVNCFGNMVAKGLHGSVFGAALQQIGLTCVMPGTSNVAHAPPLANFPVGVWCGSNEVMVGVRSGGTEFVKNLTPLCAPESEVRAGSRNVAAPGTMNPSSEGITRERLCPAGMAVKGLRSRTHVPFGLKSLELTCDSIGDRSTFPIQAPIEAVTANVAGSRSARHVCAGNSALVGLTYNAGQWLDRLGGDCNQVVTSCSGSVCRDNLLFSRRMIPSEGGWGGSAAQDRCWDNEALVGLTVRVGDSVDGIQGLCAPAATWSDPASTVAPRTLSHRGGMGGSPVTRTCPRGRFLVGWTIKSDEVVRSVEPICRDFK